MREGIFNFGQILLCLKHGTGFKKRCVFLRGYIKIVVFWEILGDELRCVFPKLVKKKRTPIRHSKSKKVRFFISFEEKVFLGNKFHYLSNHISGILFFLLNSTKKAPFWILSDELGCVFFFSKKIKTHPNSSLKIHQNFEILTSQTKKNLHCVAIRSLIFNHLVLTFIMKYLEF